MSGSRSVVTVNVADPSLFSVAVVVLEIVVVPQPPEVSFIAVTTTFVVSSARSPMATLVTLNLNVTAIVGWLYWPVQTYAVDCQLQVDWVRIEPLPELDSLPNFENTRKAEPPVVAVVQRGSEAGLQPCV